MINTKMAKYGEIELYDFHKLMKLLRLENGFYEIKYQKLGLIRFS